MARCPFCADSLACEQTLEGGIGLHDCPRCGRFLLAPGAPLPPTTDSSLRTRLQDWIFFENLHGRVPLIDGTWAERVKAGHPGHGKQGSGKS